MTSARGPRIAAALAVAGSLLLTACGGREAKSSDLVNLDRPAPVADLNVVPGSGDVLISTNRGLWRIADGEATRIDAIVSAREGRSPIGNFLPLAPAGDVLFGSGHPDARGRLRNFLGLLRSDDGGRNWRTVSRYGFSDLHILHYVAPRLYAFDALLPAVIVSDDRGRTWSEQIAPSGFVFDFAVDPENGDRMLLSFEDRIMGSEDGGRSWEPLGSADRARLAWPAEDKLYRADRDGRVFSSDNGGDSWSLIGLIDGEPWQLEATGPEDLLAALKDATILKSDDGGQDWEEFFTP
jgi:photosystem II stability/assembly factor-like uncharacterized protein